MSLPASPFTFGERVGLVLLAEASWISACAIISLLSYIAYSAVCITRGSSRRWRLGGPAEVYFLNQLGWDLVQAAGGLMNIKWVVDASVQPGTFCSAQGAVKQMSDIGSALSTLIISLYTFRTLCFPETHRDGQIVDEEGVHKKNLHRSLIVVACLWASLGFLVTINVAVDGVHRFYGPTGYWCWIRADYPVQRTATDFVFIWITAMTNIVIYAILFLYFRGYITTNGWHIQMSCKPEPVNVLGPLKQAYGLLFYPLVYILAILPLSIVRYSTFTGHHVPFAITIFVDIIYLSSGVFNVLLFSITRPFLLPHDPPSSDTMTQIPHDISIIGPSFRESLDEMAGTERPQSLGFPRCESPVNDYWPDPDSASEGSVRGSPPSDEKWV